PPRHQGLHGADRRRGARRRHRRLEISQSAGRILQCAVQARHRRDGARKRSEFGEFAILHHVRRRRLPQRQVYGGGGSPLRHGGGRKEKGGRAGGRPRRHAPRESRRGRKMTGGWGGGSVRTAKALLGLAGGAWFPLVGGPRVTAVPAPPTLAQAPHPPLNTLN